MAIWEIVANSDNLSAACSASTSIAPQSLLQQADDCDWCLLSVGCWILAGVDAAAIHIVFLFDSCPGVYPHKIVNTSYETEKQKQERLTTVCLIKIKANN